MKEFSAQQRAAIATATLLIDGPQRATELARRLYDTPKSIYDMLDNVSGVLPLQTDGRWWYLDIAPMADTAGLLGTVEARIDEIPEGVAFCRPLSRKDMVRLARVLRHVLKVVQAPCPE